MQCISKTNLKNAIASRIGELREIRPDGFHREDRITQQELAMRIGVSRQTVANIEGGRQYLPLHLLYAICIALDIEIIDILPTAREIAHLDVEAVYNLNEQRRTVNVAGVAHRVPEDLAERLKAEFGE